MCNTLETQRRIIVGRLVQKFVGNTYTTLGDLFSEAFDAGVLEAQREEAPPTDDAQLDEAMREIEAERDAIMGGCVEPPRGGWLCQIRARGMGDDS